MLGAEPSVGRHHVGVGKVGQAARTVAAFADHVRLLHAGRVDVIDPLGLKVESLEHALEVIGDVDVRGRADRAEGDEVAGIVQGVHGGTSIANLTGAEKRHWIKDNTA